MASKQKHGKAWQNVERRGYLCVAFWQWRGPASGEVTTLLTVSDRERVSANMRKPHIHFLSQNVPHIPF